MKEITNTIQIVGISDNLPLDAKAFKEIQIEETLKFPQNTPPARKINMASIRIQINSTRIEKDISSTSLEGQKLTGYSVNVEGKINIRLEYSAELTKSDLKLADFVLPFLSCIPLGDDFTPNSEVTATPYLEDAYIRMTGSSSILVSLLLSLEIIPVY